MKTFDVPVNYRSPLISAIKQRRKEGDKMKKDFSPTLLDFGTVRIYLARHFGFCYGVENAIDIAFKTIEENKGKRIFLLSEMIHNPQVNQDLVNSGIRFLQDTSGKQLIPFSALLPDDIVLTPAFGTTLEIEQRLKDMGISPEKYDATCPFVEKVWNRSHAIAKNSYTIIIHGKPNHEETRATFSHAAATAPAVIVENMAGAKELAEYILGQKPASQFYTIFKGQHTANFSVNTDLEKIGVVNQTTMLASDTQAIADYLKEIMQQKWGAENLKEHFADTRDTLCYATNDNQTAVAGLLEVAADLAIVAGGYNSSNTLHLVELCQEKLPTYFINSPDKLLSKNSILHYDFHTGMELVSKPFLAEYNNPTILITSGASCPDAIVQSIIERICSFFPGALPINHLTGQFRNG